MIWESSWLVEKCGSGGTWQSFHVYLKQNVQFVLNKLAVSVLDSVLIIISGACFCWGGGDKDFSLAAHWYNKQLRALVVKQATTLLYL